MVEFYLNHVFKLSAAEEKHKLWFDKNRTHDFRTSKCAGYLLDLVYKYICVCVFIQLHITAQSGPVILVILCHSH